MGALVPEWVGVAVEAEAGAEAEGVVEVVEAE